MTKTLLDRIAARPVRLLIDLCVEERGCDIDSPDDLTTRKACDDDSVWPAKVRKASEGLDAAQARKERQFEAGERRLVGAENLLAKTVVLGEITTEKSPARSQLDTKLKFTRFTTDGYVMRLGHYLARNRSDRSESILFDCTPATWSELK